MMKEWIDLCTDRVLTPGDFWTASRKNFASTDFIFHDVFNPELKVEDAGYTGAKMTALKKLYIHEPSLSTAVRLWEKRVNATKPGSVGFSCYNHILKSHSGVSANKRSSMMGPCLQAVVIAGGPDKMARMEIFYRTTELFKKFPADLVLIRDHMLSRFDFSDCPLTEVKFIFSTMTVSPTYVGIFLVHTDPVDILKEVKKSDPRFHMVCCKWMVRMLDPKRGLQDEKFNQSRRVMKSLRADMAPKVQSDLMEYMLRSLRE